MATHSLGEFQNMRTQSPQRLDFVCTSRTLLPSARHEQAANLHSGVHERKALRQKTMPVTTTAPMSAQISILSHPPLSTRLLRRKPVTPPSTAPVTAATCNSARSRL